MPSGAISCARTGGAIQVTGGHKSGKIELLIYDSVLTENSAEACFDIFKKN